uniref:Putative terminase n=2 Tax=viral metagenome TaxID=1070528 RepID=A0A6M3XBC9_9ZZZZ
MMASDKLTPKQEMFCKEYLVDLNATQAAIRAGYSEKTAASVGCENLIKPYIQECIQSLMKSRVDRTEITQNKVLMELAILAFSDLADYLDIIEDTGAIRAKSFKEMEGNKSRAIESIKEDRAIKENANGDSVTVYDKVSFKLHSKIRALELLGKHLGMFVDNVKLSGDVGLAVRAEDMLKVYLELKSGAGKNATGGQ